MLKVLYVLGYARSGTTLLGNLLGELDGVFHMGEAHHVWNRASREELNKNRCGCGAPVPRCEVWDPILDEVAGEIARRRLLPTEMATRPECFRHVCEWQRRAQGRWGTLGRLRPGTGDATEADRRYLAVLEALYRATANATGARVLIDSSKLPGPARLLHRMPGVVPHFIHIVRDPRGVVLSRQRRGAARVGAVYRLSLARTVAESVRWLRDNVGAELVARRLPPQNHLFTTYEGFIADPRGTLTRILAALGEAPRPLPFIQDHHAVLRGNHTICGNRNRFASGAVPLRLDDGWRHTLRRSDRWLITALTGIGLFRYGYIPRPAVTAAP